MPGRPPPGTEPWIRIPRYRLATKSPPPQYSHEAALLELRSAGLKSTDAQSLHRIYVNGAVTHLLRGSLQDVGWCDLWDSHVEQFWEKLLYTELTAAQRVHVHLPLSSEYTGRGVQSARWRREAAFLGSWHLCLGSVAVALRFVSAGQLLQAAQRSVRVPLAEAASVIRTLVPGYSFDADALFEEPDAKRQSELMEAVYAAKEATLVDALWNKNPRGDAVAAARHRAWRGLRRLVRDPVVLAYRGRGH